MHKYGLVQVQTHMHGGTHIELQGKHISLYLWGKPKSQGYNTYHCNSGAIKCIVYIYIIHFWAL